MSEHEIKADIERLLAALKREHVASAKRYLEQSLRDERAKLAALQGRRRREGAEMPPPAQQQKGKDRDG